MGDDELCLSSFTSLAPRIREGDLSPVELTAAVLRRIERLDPELGGYLTLLPEAATECARAVEKEIRQGHYRGPLHGIPVAVKDLCDTKGVRTTCASRILAERVPDQDAMVVEKLQAAGGILLGKLNLTEFAMGWYHPSLPMPLNPWARDRWCGSSSSGSGVATAAGLCFGALGSDTGGSIRFPAAACGVVGLKPTYGRVSRHGVFPLAESLDHVGPFARSVADAAALLDAIAGFDAEDPTTLRSAPPGCLANIDGGVRGVRIGLDEEWVRKDVQPEVADALLAALAVLERAGARVVGVHVPPVDEVLAAWPRVCAAEAAAAHAATFPSRADEYSAGFRSFLELGAGLSATDYARAHLVRGVWRGQLAGLFEDVDAIACPCMPTVAPSLDLFDLDRGWSEAMLVFMRFSAPFNMSRSPSLSLPCGITDDGLPIAMQLVGRHGEEALLCRAGHAYESATRWHRLHPPV